jgi:hypothetical protein
VSGEEVSDDDTRVHIAELRVELRETRHDLKNLLQAISGLPTSRDMSALEARVESLEASRDWVVKAVVGAWVAGAGVVALFGRKVGI